MTTELTHSKLNLVYLAELLVVVTDRLKIVRIHARNVHHVHGHKRLDDDAFLASLSRSRKLVGKYIYIAYNFSHFAIYLPKLIKIHGSSDRNKNAQFLRHAVY